MGVHRIPTAHVPNEVCAAEAGSVYSVHYTASAPHADGVSREAQKKFNALQSQARTKIRDAIIEKIRANDDDSSDSDSDSNSAVAKAVEKNNDEEGDNEVNNNVNFLKGNFEVGPTTGVYVIGADGRSGRQRGKVGATGDEHLGDTCQFGDIHFSGRRDHGTGVGHSAGGQLVVAGAVGCEHRRVQGDRGVFCLDDLVDRFEGLGDLAGAQHRA